jgi:hypothetical protein
MVKEEHVRPTAENVEMRNLIIECPSCETFAIAQTSNGRILPRSNSLKAFRGFVLRD